LSQITTYSMLQSKYGMLQSKKVILISNWKTGD
jgi:hypothetical protein